MNLSTREKRTSCSSPMAAMVARRNRLERGVKLNYPESDRPDLRLSWSRARATAAAVAELMRDWRRSADRARAR